MPDYNALAARTAAQVEKFGAAAALKRAAPADYDPATQTLDDNGTQVFNTKALRADFSRSQIDGTRILATDVRLLVSSTLETEPVSGDLIEYDGETYVIVDVRVTKPAGVALLYDVQVRGA